MEYKKVFCDRCGDEDAYPMDVEFADDTVQVRVDLCHKCAISALFHRVAALSLLEKERWLKNWKSYKHEEQESPKNGSTEGKT